MPAVLKKHAGPTPGDERRTPRWLFEACEKSWGPFIIDCAATKRNALCDQWIGPGSPIREDALAGEIKVWVKLDLPDVHRRCESFHRAWLNPPYSRNLIGRFMAWAKDQAVSGWTVCCLIPLDPTTKWWKANIGDHLGYHSWIGEVRVITERVLFEFDGQTRKTKANFPSVIVVMRPPFDPRAPRGKGLMP